MSTLWEIIEEYNNENEKSMLLVSINFKKWSNQINRKVIERFWDVWYTARKIKDYWDWALLWKINIP